MLLTRGRLAPIRHAAMPPGLPPVDLATQRAAVYCVDDRIVVSYRSFTFTIALSVVLAWRFLSFLPILSSLTETRKSRDLFTPSYPPPDLASCHTATIFHTSLSRQLAVSQTTAASILLGLRRPSRHRSRPYCVTPSESAFLAQCLYLSGRMSPRPDESADIHIASRRRADGGLLI